MIPMQYPESALQKIQSYFWGRYPNAQLEARYKHARVTLALRYFAANNASLEEFWVGGDSGIIVNEPLIFAFWHYFASLPDSRLHVMPDPGKLLEIARDKKRNDLNA